MSITVTCNCGHTLKTDQRHAGKRGRCPKCGKGVDIPLPAPAIVIAQEPESEPEPELPAFAEWTPPTTTEALPSSQSVAPLPRIAHQETGGPTASERANFRRVFFGVWVCQMAYRITAWLWIAGTSLLALLAIMFIVISLIITAIRNEAPATVAGSLFGAATLLWLIPFWLASVITGFGLLATSELLTAFGWWLYRQRIGGDGPF